jgi:HD-GYP domain-containing protein (c-di-GMP phosphodiesterase class II)
MLTKVKTESGFLQDTSCVSVSLFDMLSSMSAALDLIDFNLIDHHNRVCYIATKLATHLGFSEDEINQIYMAALMHDIGAISFLDRLKLINFEVKNAHVHGELGALLLSRFEPFQSFAPLVRYHHVSWNYGEGKYHCGEKVPYGSHILHLADRISVLLDRRKPIFLQSSKINGRIIKESGKMFVPAFVDAYLDISKNAAFWLDLTGNSMDRILEKISSLPRASLGMKHLTELSNFFALIIDTRSRFTATHSSGVASSSMQLASAIGMNSTDCSKMKIAGYLHDIGKLAVPEELLLKPGKPTEEEWLTIRAHPYHTHRILERVEGLEDITFWASNHHEQLNGEGYPFGISADNLSLGARSLAVADVFTAVAEDRPYRAGMKKEEIQKVFKEMVMERQLDGEVVDALLDNYEVINDDRSSAQEQEQKKLAGFWEHVEKNAKEE